MQHFFGLMRSQSQTLDPKWEKKGRIYNAVNESVMVTPGLFMQCRGMKLVCTCVAKGEVPGKTPFARASFGRKCGKLMAPSKTLNKICH